MSFFPLSIRPQTRITLILKAFPVLISTAFRFCFHRDTPATDQCIWSLNCMLEEFYSDGYQNGLRYRFAYASRYPAN